MKINSESFKTRDLEGRYVVVFTDTNIKYTGVLVRFFESTEQLVLTNYNILEDREEDGEWEKTSEGGILILRKYAWLGIEVKGKNINHTSSRN